MMIERILEQQTAICAVLMENRSDRSLLPSTDDFTVLEELVSVLRPIQQATELLIGSKYATVSCMFPVLQQLLKHSLKTSEEDSSALRKALHKTLLQDTKIQNLACYCRLLHFFRSKIQGAALLIRDRGNNHNTKNT